MNAKLPNVEAGERPKLEVQNLNAWFGATRAVKDISISVEPRSVLAIIGPSGCGKSTFVRCLNRMHETIPDAHATGRVRIGELDVYNGTSATSIRRRIGMVFQKPNPFPTMSIYDNVAAGLKLNGYRDRKRLDEIVERSLQLHKIPANADRSRRRLRRRSRSPVVAVDRRDVAATPGPRCRHAGWPYVRARG